MEVQGCGCRAENTLDFDKRLMGAHSQKCVSYKCVRRESKSSNDWRHTRHTLSPNYFEVQKKVFCNFCHIRGHKAGAIDRSCNFPYLFDDITASRKFLEALGKADTLHYGLLKYVKHMNWDPFIVSDSRYLTNRLAVVFHLDKI